MSSVLCTPFEIIKKYYYYCSVKGVGFGNKITHISCESYETFYVRLLHCV